jgi:DNA helicase-2/ATP-dependent DNA helicase PcrA
MNTLTPEQQAVANHQTGHAKVVAVAGAGKTTTLVHFIEQRLLAGCDPRRLLVLMYNKSAQTDFQIKLQSRIQQSGLSTALPDIRTFHSLGLKIYQRLIAQGLLSGYQDKLISSVEMESVVWRLLQQVADEDVRQDILSQRKKWVEPAVSFIELVKSDLVGPEIIFEDSDLPNQCRIFIETFYRFEDWRKQHNRISFSDMIYDPCKLFQQQPEVARQFGGHMQWILVDEYQDINAIQQFMLQTLYGDGGYRGEGNVMVIGDSDQTIYEFRGSKPEFINHEFEKAFSASSNTSLNGCTSYSLPHTFRYGHALSLLANHIISENEDREDVMCLSHSSTPQTQVDLIHGEDYSAETLKLIDQLTEQYPLEDIAILNRLWGISAPIELSLLRKNIPYQLDHSQTVLDRWELEVFWLLFELAADVFNRRNRKERKQAWLTLLTQPFPKIKRAVLEDMAEAVSQAEGDYSQAWWDAIPDDMSKWQKQQLEDRGHVIEMAEQAALRYGVNTGAGSAKQLQAWQLAKQYIETTDLYEGIRDSAFSSQQIEDRQQTIKAFVQFLRAVKTPAAECYSYLMGLKENHQNKERTGIRLTSIHKAKGLEWPVVIIPALSSRYYPYEPEGQFISAGSEESERRLLYVAMTRAKQSLFLIAPPKWSSKKKNKGQKHQQAQDWPSKFLRELAFDCCKSSAYFLNQKSVAEQSDDQKSSQQSVESETPDKSRAILEQYVERCQLDANIQITKRHEEKNISESSADYQQTGADGLVNNHHRFIDPDLDYQPGQYLKHGKLGRGKVIKEDKQYLTMRFDGESKDRTLNKEIASPWLELN